MTQNTEEYLAMLSWKERALKAEAALGAAQPVPLPDDEREELVSRLHARRIGYNVLESEIEYNADRLANYVDPTPVTDAESAMNTRLDALVDAACQALHQAEKQALGAAEAAKWISVDEKLPEIDKPVLFCIETGAKKVGAYTLVRYAPNSYAAQLERYEWEVNSEEGYETESVTHWQPLPAAPAQTVKGGQPDAA